MRFFSAVVRLPSGVNTPLIAFGNLPTCEPASALLTTLEEGVKNAKETLDGFDDRKLLAEWKVEKDGQQVMSMPRIRLVRAILLNHWYHHRGQLSVYLRLLDVPIPSIYGPSADENPFA